MSLTSIYNTLFANQTQNQSSALGQQNTQGEVTGLSNVVTTTTAGTGAGIGQLAGNYYYPNQIQTGYYNPISQWVPPEKVLTIKEVALLHRMCGDDEEVRAVLNKILPHFRMEA